MEIHQFPEDMLRGVQLMLKTKEVKQPSVPITVDVSNSSAKETTELVDNIQKEMASYGLQLRGIRCDAFSPGKLGDLEKTVPGTNFEIQTGGYYNNTPVAFDPRLDFEEIEFVFTLKQ